MLPHESWQNDNRTACSFGDEAARSWDNRSDSGRQSKTRVRHQPGALDAESKSQGGDVKAQRAKRETSTVTEDMRNIAVLTLALRVICIANQLKLHRESMTVTRPPHGDVELDFAGRVPFGFAFTEGHEATFHVPSGHRYVIEQLNVSCWTKNQQINLQLLTRSQHIFRQMTMSCGTEERSRDEQPCAYATVPIMVTGSTTNTLLFGDGKTYSSPTVPPHSYVQLWGYLEPVYHTDVS